MGISEDPENNETRALCDLVDLSAKHILEIGCGDGRLTFRYAHSAGHVTAVDSWSEGIERAKKDLPGSLKEQVEFLHTPFLEFSPHTATSTFDMAILSWSL